VACNKIHRLVYMAGWQRPPVQGATVAKKPRYLRLWQSARCLRSIARIFYLLPAERRTRADFKTVYDGKESRTHRHKWSREHLL